MTPKIIGTPTVLVAALLAPASLAAEPMRWQITYDDVNGVPAILESRPFARRRSEDVWKSRVRDLAAEAVPRANVKRHLRSRGCDVLDR